MDVMFNVRKLAEMGRDLLVESTQAEESVSALPRESNASLATITGIRDSEYPA